VYILFQAEITVFAKNLRVYGEGRDKENVYAAIDLAYSRVEKQLKKCREKLKSHHRGMESNDIPPKVQMAEAIYRDEIHASDKPEIIKLPLSALKPMSADEASLEIETGKQPFLAFLNTSTRQVNVIYQREDGNHGLIEP
jgi:putative sigma-54 modulation protein